MSWSFNATGTTKADALREFDNKLVENNAHIPDNVRPMLSDAAKNLADTLPSTGHEITVTSSGHVGRDYSGNLDGTGNMRVAISYVPAKEEIPNMPKRSEDDKANGGPAVDESSTANGSSVASDDNNQGIEPRV